MDLPVAFWVFAFSYSTYFWLAKTRLPLDQDSANHLRLARAWVQGAKPTHSYSLGVKIGLPAMYRSLKWLIRSEPRRFRYIYGLGYSLLHVFLAEMTGGDLGTTWPLHLVLFLVILLPTSFSASSSLDLLQPTLLLIAYLAIGDQENLLGVIALTLAVSALILANKFSDVFLVPILFFSIGSDAVDILVATAIVLSVSVVSLKVINRSGTIIQYRKTRKLLRKKVIFPLIALMPLYSLLLAHTNFDGHVEVLLVSLALLNFLRNLASGDYLTGAPSFPITIYLSLAYLISPHSEESLFVVLGFGLLAQIAPILLSAFTHLSWADGIRIFATGDRYPGLTLEASRRVAQLRSEGFFRESDFFVLEMNELAIMAGASERSSFPYSTNHLNLWLKDSSLIDRILRMDGGRVITDSEQFALRLTEHMGNPRRLTIALDPALNLLTLELERN